MSLTWTAATDNVGVVRYNVHRSTTAGFTPSAGEPDRAADRTSYTDSGLAAGAYYYKVTAEDAAGNVSAASNEAGATVTARRRRPRRRVRLRRRQRHDARRSVRQRQQRHARERDLDAAARQVRQRALVQRDERLGDRPGRGLARPDDRDDARGLGAADALVGGLAHRDLQGAARRPRLRPLREHRHATARAGTSSRRRDSDCAERARSRSNTWTHLAATYDGANLRLYVNGTQAATRSPRRLDPHLDRRLRIGGNTIWGEWFTGLIDEVRVYNRALTAAEIQADMNADQRARHERPERARNLARDRRPRPGRPHLGSRDGQRRRRPLQRPPRHERRLHAVAGEPGRPADRRRATPTPGSPPAPTTTR